jgi:hypothetical protein
MSGIKRILTIARGTVGLTQDDAAFHALCGPGERPEKARELARRLTSALFLRGCLASVLAEQDTCAGCGGDGCDTCGGKPPAVPPRLWAPCKIGMAMADLVAVCRHVNACAMEAKHRQLRSGALVIVGSAGHEHVYLIESIERDGWPDGSIDLTAIEAGQVDAAGRQCVRRKRHEISPQGVDRTWGGPLPDGHHMARRRADDTVPLPDSARGEPIIARPVAYILDPRALLEPR